MTLHSGLSAFLIWAVTFPPIQLTEFYISQLVRYARICTSKVDFINRLRGLSLRLRQRGFDTNRHGLIVEKYGAALREMRLQSRLELHHRILTSLIYY